MPWARKGGNLKKYKKVITKKYLHEREIK